MSSIKMQKRFVLGDIHGNYKALKEVLISSNFDYEEDKLIILGDVVDGHKQTFECVEELLKIKNLIFVRGNHDCIDSETEILTKCGWKTHSNISNNDKVLNYNTKTNIAEYNKINSIIKKEYNGKAYEVNNKFMNAILTPNHKILNSIYNKNEWKYNTIEELYNTKFEKRHIKTALKLINNKYNISNNEIKFAAWILTDGSIDKYGNFKIYQSKKNTIKRIKKLLNDMNIIYLEKVRNRDIKKINNKTIKQCLPQHIFSINLKKNIKLKQIINKKYINPEWVYKLSQKQFDIYLKELIYGDGSFYKTRNCYILYGTYEFLSEVQRACLQYGYSANIKKDNRETFRLNILKKENRILLKNNIKKIKYSDIFWCIDTNNGNFICRRNGKVYITGNCWFMRHMSHGFSDEIWLQQGGANTLRSYGASVLESEYITNDSLLDLSNCNIPITHQDLFNRSILYHEEDEMVFVHGGFRRGVPMDKQKQHTLLWDRSLLEVARVIPIEGFQKKYQKIFIGHTTTEREGAIPIKLNNLWMIDSGAGWKGRLCIMDCDTEEYWLSDWSKGGR